MGFADDLIKNKKKLEEQISGNSGSSFADTLIANKQLMNQASTIGTLDNVNSVVPTIDTNTITNQLTNAVQQTTPILPQKDNMNLGQKLGYVGESFGSGILGGATQMINAPYQNAQEGAERAQNNTATQNLQSLLYKNILPGNLGRLPDIMNEINQIANDPNKGGWEKALNMAMETANGLSLAGKLEDAGQLYGFAQQLLNRNGAKDIQQGRDILQTPSNALQKDVAKKGENLNGGWKLAGQVGQATGNMIPSIGLSLLTGDPSSASAQALSLASMGVSAKGQATEEALQKGADLSEANRIGAAKGMVEVGTEKLTGGLSWFGKGSKFFGKSIDDVANKVINDNVKNSVANFVLKKVLGGLGEVGEEVISDIAGIAIDKATTDPNASYGDYFKNGDFWNTVITTLLTTGILETGYDVAGKAITGKSAYQINKEELGRIGKVQDMVNEEISNTDTSKMSKKEINDLKSQLETKYTNMLEQGVRDIISQADEEAFYQGKRTGGSELQEIEQQDIKDTANALNLEENVEENIEENLEEDTNEEQQETTPTTTELELNLENQTQNQTQNNINVTTGLEDYIKNNNITELTEENIEDYINEYIEQQGTELNEQERKSLIDDYKNQIKEYAKDNDIPVIEAPKIEIPDMTAESKAPSKAIGRETRNEIKNQVNAFNNAVKSDQYKVGNQVKEQYKNLETKSINKLDNDALKYNLLAQEALKGKKATETSTRRESVQPVVQRKADVTTTIGQNFARVEQAQQRTRRLQESANKTGYKGDSRVISNIAKVLDNLGVEGSFDSSFFTNNDTNGLHTIDENGKRKIVFNPNADSDTIIEELSIHEMAHDLLSKSKSFKKINPQEILDYVSKMDGYQEARAALEEEYSKHYDRNSENFKDMIDEEVVVSVLGKNLGNQEFINNLTQQKPSVARSIYNWVVGKLNSIINKNGVKSERLYWANVKKNFEEAFRLEDKGDLTDSALNETSKYHVSKNASKDIDNVLTNISERNPVRLRDFTPKVMVETGIKDLPMFENPSHIRKNILTEEEAKKIGLKINPNDHYHGLGKETYLKAIDSLDNPRVIFRNNNTGDYIALSTIKDNDGNTIIVPIDIETTTTANNINIDTNRIKSVYGYENQTQDLNNYIKDNINSKVFTKIYEQKKNKSTGKFPQSSSYETSVSQNRDNVKFSINTKTGKLQENGKNVTLDTSNTGTTGTLMAIHNLSEEKLKGILELGGFPVPSIAITNPNITNHKSFGDISVLFDKSTIDPAIKSNEVYDRDVWSPTFPTVESEIIEENLEKVADEIGIRDYYLEDYAERHSNIDDLIYTVLREDDVVNKYLDENNINYDKNLSRKEIRQIAIDNGINEYLKDKLKDIFGEKGIYNGKEYITSSGKRRTFWQTHDKYNLANIVKLLTRKSTINGQDTSIFSGGFGNIQANMSQRFNSIQEIKNAETRLKSTADNDIKPLQDNLSDSISKLTEYYGGYTSSNPFTTFSKVSEDIVDFASKKEQNISTLKEMLDEYGYKKVPDSILKDIVKSINDLKNIPTDYFEAKPQRAVGLDEVQQIVIPNNVDAEFKKQLQDAGLQYTEYDPNIEGDRQRVINQFDNLKFSQNQTTWDEFLNKNIKSKGTKTKLGDLRVEKDNEVNNTSESKTPQDKSKNALTDSVKAMNLEKETKKVEKPKKDRDNLAEAKKDEVLQLKTDKGKKIDLKKTSNNIYERVETPKKTDVMPDMSNDTVTIGDKKVSNFYSNITEKSKFITEENRASLQDNENLKYYNSITNKDTLLDAMGKLDANAEQQIGDFFAKDSFNAEDMATGWILIKRYQDAGNYEAMSNVIETMRDKGTKSGQAIQMLGMLNRLTPEGMEFYAQRQLDNAYNKFVENKSKKEIDKYAQDFTLTPEEHQFIKDTMEKVEKMTNEDDKKVEVAKIVKMLSDKLPPEKGSRIKAWMRISMLGNPKTQVRNVVGNAIIQPFNWLGDTVASRIDKIMSKKTGIRTKGNTDFGALAGGFVKGAKEAVRDAKLGIDTRDINLDRFEENIGAKPFYEGHKSKALNAGAKVLNKTNQILGNVMSGGDRVFYQAIYDNSLKNQMKLNNVTTPTQEMMQIAEQEALSRTWNDSNEYTKAVLQIRNAMNKLNVKGYGLGDVLVPFAKTPANLTKAIVDYSPVGLVRSILQDGKNYRNSLQNGQYNAQIQHKFADSLGKGFAGTILWAAAYALAQAGITTGASDDDKDVANFMRNTLGIQPYSVKIGNKSFTYDWAQPIAAPFAAMADFKRLSEKEEKDFGTIVQTAISSASNILLEQSFLSSIQDVFNSYEGPAAAIKQQIEDLPARATPTFFKQIADLIDPVQRQTYVKGNTGETVKNKVQVKIPGASKELTAQRDTLGREIKKYGGDDNIAQYAFNVFLNPANTNKGKPSAAAEEIYDVYKNTGDKTVMPRQVGYSENVGGTTIPLSAEERNEWQRLSGEKIEDSVKALTSNPKYNSMSYEDKADVINGIVNYSFAKAKSDMFGTQISTQYKTASKKEAEGIPIADYYVDRISKRK